MLLRLVDHLKLSGITAVFTSLTHGGDALEQTEVAVSSLVDTWLLLRDLERDGERDRGLYVLKSRGMSHSNQIREFKLTSQGIELRDVYLGAGGFLTGSARLAQEVKDQAHALRLQQDSQRKKRALEAK